MFVSVWVGGAQLPAVGTVVGPEGDVQVTAQTFLVPAVRSVRGRRDNLITSASGSAGFVHWSPCSNHQICTKQFCSWKKSPVCGMWCMVPNMGTHVWT